MRRVVLAFCGLAIGWSCAAGQTPLPGVETPKAVDQKAPNAPPAPSLVFGSDETVLLKVSLIEVSVTELRRKGVDFEKLLADNAPNAEAAKAKPAEAEGELFGEWKPGGSGCFLVNADDKLLVKMKKLVKEKTARIVAQPILVTTNGRAASFSSGGELPVPVPQSGGTTTIEWKKHGLQLDFVPVVLEKETLRLDIRVRISELDPLRDIKIGDTTVPGISSTELDTAFKMKTDQVAVISGGMRSVVVDVDANGSETNEERAILVLLKPEIVKSAE